MNVANPPDPVAIAAANAAALLAARTARSEDEFKSIIIAPDMKLINPGTKDGRILFDSFAKTDVKAEDKFKGRSSEIEAFRKTLKSISTKFNCGGVLKFTHAGKDHDLASAPERTTAAELFEYNKNSIWSFEGTIPIMSNVQGGLSSAVSLHDKAKVTDDDKAILRKVIDIRARNQIILKIIKDSTDPDFLSTLLSKKANKKLLQWGNSDLLGNIIIDGSMLLLLISKQICPSTISLVNNLKSEAKALKIQDFDNDVSAIVGKFEEYLERIQSYGKDWDDSLSAFFDVLSTSSDSRFNTAMTIKNNEYLAGTLTDVSDLSEHAVTIYTNLKANKKWMIPDPKEAQIIALTTRIDGLVKLANTKQIALTTATEKKKPYSTSVDPARFVYTGKDKVNFNGVDNYWCDDESHCRMPGSTNGLYCSTHGKGHPTIGTHAAWKAYKEANPYNKRKKEDVAKEVATPNGAISLNEKLKAALLTKTSCTVEDLEALGASDF